MAKIEQTIDINSNLQACFDQWMQFESFPKFMSHVKRITHESGKVWHWVVSGPMGAELDWDAEMDGKIEDRMVSWHSISDSTVKTQGTVTFDELSPQMTRVTVMMNYDTPAGVLGELFAKIFSNPDVMVRQDLESFKELMESKVQVQQFA